MRKQLYPALFSYSPDWEVQILSAQECFLFPYHALYNDKDWYQHMRNSAHKHGCLFLPKVNK